MQIRGHATHYPKYFPRSSFPDLHEGRGSFSWYKSGIDKQFEYSDEEVWWLLTEAAVMSCHDGGYPTPESESGDVRFRAFWGPLAQGAPPRMLAWQKPKVPVPALSREETDMAPDLTCLTVPDLPVFEIPGSSAALPPRSAMRFEGAWAESS